MNPLFRRGLLWFTAWLLLVPCAPADTTFVVNRARSGSPDYTDLNTCLSAINSGSDTKYTVQFTDTAATQYDLSPSETTMRDGIHLTFSSAVEGVVTVNGRLDVAQAGGTFSATGIHFMTTSNWVFLQGYDGQTYTRCTFGPGNDNGLVIRGGVNTVTDCTFSGVTNSAIIASGGVTHVNSCIWTGCGRCALSQNAGDTNPADSLIIDGGSATQGSSGYVFVVTGFRTTVSDFDSTGFATAVTHDWETGSDGGPATFAADNCTFRGLYDRAVACYQNVPDSAGKDTTITLTNCLLERRADDNADGVAVDGRGNGADQTVILNGCTIRALIPQNTGSGLLVWTGGTIQADNTVIDGGANGVNCSSENSGAWAAAKLNHCVIVNAKTQATTASDFAMTRLWIRNTIVDATDAGGINASGSNLETLIDSNLINAPGSTDGSHVATGDPLYVDAAADNYRHLFGSAACQKGTPTDLLYDVDGVPYDPVAPDIGINQVIGEAPTPTPTFTPTPIPTPLPPPAQDNSILPNGNLEQQFVDYAWPVIPFWDYTDNINSTLWATVDTNPTYAQEGNRYLTIDYSAANTIAVTHMIFPVEPGATYRVSFYYRVESGQAMPSGSTTVVMRWFNDYTRGTAIQLGGAVTLATGLGATTSGWVQTEADVTVPKNVVAADLLISGNSPSGAGKIHFDNFAVQKTSGPYSATLHMLFEANTFQNGSSTALAEFVASMAGMLSQVGAGDYIYIHNLYGNNADDLSATQYRWACLLASFWGARLDFSNDTKYGCWQILNNLKSLLPKQKFIRYDYSDNLSCRWVMSLCGLEQCPAANDSIVPAVESNLGLTEQESVMSGSGGTDTEAKAWARFTADSSANRDLILENSAESGYLGNQNSNGNYKYYLSDLAVAEKAWFFWDADRGEPQNTYLSWMNTNFRHLGVLAGNEGDRIADVSVRGGTVVPADYSWNLATHRLFHAIDPVHRIRARPYTMRDLTWENGVSYCTFVMTDGDNLQVIMGSYSTDPRWFGSPRRGSMAMGWQLPPSADRFAPVLMAHYLDPLLPSSLKDDECALTGVSGDGVFYVGAADDTAHTLGALTTAGRDAVLTQQAEGLNQWMKKYAINCITGFVWNDAAWNSSQSGWDVYGEALERPLGFLVDTYDASYTSANGALKWTHDTNGYEVPVKACDFALWDPAQSSWGHTPTDMASILNAIPHPATPTPASFSYVCTHAWSWNDTSSGQPGIAEQVYQTQQLLNNYVRAVRPDEFLMQIRLRLQTAETLNEYYGRLDAKVTELEGKTAPTSDAAADLSQARQTLTQAQPLISTDPEQAFNLLKQADQQTEVARLSFITETLSGKDLLFDCPDEASPLYSFSARETDPAALAVAQYEVQFADNVTFAPPYSDVFIASGALPVPSRGGYARVRAQGDSHGDWGAWSAPLSVQSTGVCLWQLY